MDAERLIKREMKALIRMVAEGLEADLIGC